jgi:hypothetical protein
MARAPGNARWTIPATKQREVKDLEDRASDPAPFAVNTRRSSYSRDHRKSGAMIGDGVSKVTVTLQNRP